MAFAHRLCHMFKEDELRATLAYLDEAGPVIYPQRSKKLRNEKLKNIVVTKPRWLFRVFSVVASVTARPPPLLSKDWDRVQKKGIASWNLIDYRLQEAGVKRTEYEDVLNLFNWFFLLCLKHQPCAVALPYETEYFVPCLLEFESEGPFTAAASVASSPMSLVILPQEIDFIPEQLHFRLMTCCINEYDDEPKLTRNYSVYHVEDIELELIYYAKKYIIVSIDTQQPLHKITSLCTGIRKFITEKLHEVRTPGLPRFDFSVNIQHPGPAVSVDENKLVCIDQYGHRPLVGRNGRSVRLRSDEKAALDCWFHEEKDDVDAAATTQQSLASRANRKCTNDDVVNVAEEVSSCWQRLVLKLDPSFFMNKTRVIERENRDDCYMQAVTVLNMWISKLSDNAKRQSLIKAMCDIGCRSAAEKVFSHDLVQHVCPLVHERRIVV